MLAFFHERLKIYLKEEGARYDVLEAVLNKDADDFLLVARHVEVLIAFINTHEGNSFLTAVKRTVNILENEFQKGAIITNDINPEFFIEIEEKQLYQAIIEIEKKINDRFTVTSLPQILDILAPLGKFIDIFFKKVLVNDKDVHIRTNRLALLGRINTMTQTVADFSKLVV
ncbi:DALR anticodon-binding domain-containing protein [Bartonella birtlesii]|uniref:DALR anticodon-binding domain-containing protein n=1 Tax=Bartonella birtlesii TaxID=111504 RepID=UPI0003F85807|nr:DALR anticodon-binding domain-containing protein [Bartonella birtlesii]